MRRNSDKYKYFGSDKGETYKTVICNNCGYYVKFAYASNKEKLICSGCGHYVFKNKKIEFKEKMKERMKKVNENEERNNNYN